MPPCLQARSGAAGQNAKAQTGWTKRSSGQNAEVFFSSNDIIKKALRKFYAGR